MSTKSSSPFLFFIGAKGEAGLSFCSYSNYIYHNIEPRTHKNGRLEEERVTP